VPWGAIGTRRALVRGVSWGAIITAFADGTVTPRRTVITTLTSRTIIAISARRTVVTSGTVTPRRTVITTLTSRTIIAISARRTVTPGGVVLARGAVLTRGAVAALGTLSAFWAFATFARGLRAVTLLGVLVGSALAGWAP